MKYIMSHVSSPLSGLLTDNKKVSQILFSLPLTCLLTVNFICLCLGNHLFAQSHPAVASSSDMQPKQSDIQSKDSSKVIHFENGLSWEQIKEKAKAEHKYIFVDCYATWCGPCK